MVKHTKTGKGRLDKYYHLAKEQGFRARSAYKLIQLNPLMYQFLKNAKTVIDLCAAPGGWMQVCAKEMPSTSTIIGVDIVHIKPIHNCIAITEDITTDKCRQALKQAMKQQKAEVVLHDGAPNVGGGGAWTKDAFNQVELTLHAFKLATEFLVAGGWFVTKVFRSQDYNSLLWVLQQFFQKVEATKPQASRNESAEIFVVCQAYLAPKKIDPRLFDPKHVFKVTADDGGTQKVDVFKAKGTERSRGGYEDGAVVLFKRATVEEFLQNEDPVRVLTDFTEIVFASGLCRQARALACTTEEVVECLKDIRVLGKKDLKQLLQWREQCRQHLGLETDDDAVQVQPLEVAENSDDELESALSGARQRERAKSKKMKKMEMKKAQRLRGIIASGTNHGDYTAPQDEELFTLRDVRTQQQLDSIADANVGDAELGSDSEPSILAGESEESEVEFDSDDEMADRKRRIMDVEKNLDFLYGQYLDRRGKTVQQERRKRPKQLLAEAESEWWKEQTDSTPLEAPDMTKDVFADSDDEGQGAALQRTSALVVEVPKQKPVRAKVVNRWLSNPGLDSLLGDDDDDDMQALPKRAGKKGRRDQEEVQEEEEVEDVVFGPAPPVAARKSGGSAGGGGVGGGVNMLATQDSDSDTSYEDDPESMAEIAAMGAALLRKNVRKEDVVDSSYHRFAFSDSSMAPDWFQAEERRCNRFTMPLTKEEIGAAKSQFNSINARTIKKVAEATGRKKMRAKKAMEKAKAKANSIAESDEMGMKAKQRSIEKLYLKAQGKMKPEEKKVSKRGNTLQKGSKNQPRISKGGGKNLDGRLRKDKKNTSGKQKRDKIGGAKTGRVARIRALRGKGGKK